MAVNAPQPVLIESSQIVNFNFAMADVRTLLDLHDELTQQLRGRPDRSIEVYKRAAVILSVTAWETFIEDSILESSQIRINTAANPNSIEATFNHVAAYWLDTSKKNPNQLAKWAGDGWKDMLREKLKQDVSDLNTPKAAQIKALSKRYLGFDLTTYWKWRNTTAAQAARRLDALITLRGNLVHRGRQMLGNAAVRRADVEDALGFLPRLAQITEVALDRQPKPPPL